MNKLKRIFFCDKNCSRRILTFLKKYILQIFNRRGNTIDWSDLRSQFQNITFQSYLLLKLVIFYLYLEYILRILGIKGGLSYKQSKLYPNFARGL